MGPVFVAPTELLIFCDLMPSRSGTVPCCVLHPVIITLLWSLLFEVSHFLEGEKKSGHNMNLRYIYNISRHFDRYSQGRLYSESFHSFEAIVISHFSMAREENLKRKSLSLYILLLMFYHCAKSRIYCCWWSMNVIFRICYHLTSYTKSTIRITF